MDASKANSEIKQVVHNLPSRDPVIFNSTINSHFASGCTYKGRGLEIHGASNIKHASWLFNLVDIGSAAKIRDEDIHWNQDATTAVVKAERQVRPLVFPVFQFGVPTKATLTFNAESGSKQVLYCTQWQDEWPLEKLIQSLPIVGQLYRYLFVPFATVMLLWLANFAFFVRARLGSIEHRYHAPIQSAYTQHVEPKLPGSVKHGFETGVKLAQDARHSGLRLSFSLVHRPLSVVERLAQMGTAVANVVLPESLQLPHPTVFVEAVQRGVSGTGTSQKESELQVASKQSAQSDDEGHKESSSPKQKISGMQRTQNEHTDKASQDKAEPKHAKVIVGSAEQGVLPQAKEIDVLTQHVVIEAPKKEEGASLYNQLKKDNQLPTTTTAPVSNKQGSSKKKNK